MPEKVGWGEVGEKSKLPKSEQPGANNTGGKNSLPPLKYIKFEAGGVYNIRPLQSPIVFYKYFLKRDGKYFSAICEDPSTCPIFIHHKLIPQEKYAINVIDREDGELKILEGSVSIFGRFRDCYDGSGINPGGKVGYDFQITATGDGLERRYKCKKMAKTVISQAEATMLKEHKLFQLEKIYKVTPSDQIEEKLFGMNEKIVEPSSNKIDEDDLMDELGDSDDLDGAVVSSDDDDNELDI